MISGVLRLNRVIIIIASRAEEGASVDPESCNGVIQDLEDGIRLCGSKCRCNKVAG